MKQCNIETYISCVRRIYNIKKEEGMKEVFRLQADICRTLSNPVRMEIIHVLKQGENTVTALAEATGLTKSNISQHLSVLKGASIVRSRREGVNVWYSISNQRVVEACRLMREVLLEQVAERQKLINEIK
jgi:ArsR family transcriptional regulator